MRVYSGANSSDFELKFSWENPVVSTSVAVKSKVKIDKKLYFLKDLLDISGPQYSASLTK